MSTNENIFLAKQRRRFSFINCNGSIFSVSRFFRLNRRILDCCTQVNLLFVVCREPSFIHLAWTDSHERRSCNQSPCHSFRGCLLYSLIKSPLHRFTAFLTLSIPPTLASPAHFSCAWTFFCAWLSRSPFSYASANFAFQPGYAHGKHLSVPSSIALCLTIEELTTKYYCGGYLHRRKRRGTLCDERDVKACTLSISQSST